MNIGSLVQSEAVVSLDILIPPDGVIPSALESARKRAKQDGLVLVDSLPTTANQPVIAPHDWPKPEAGTRRFTWRAQWMRGTIHKNAMIIVLSVPGAQDKDPKPLTAALNEYGGDGGSDE